VSCHVLMHSLSSKALEEMEKAFESNEALRHLTCLTPSLISPQNPKTPKPPNPTVMYNEVFNT